ncbi:MAG: D-tyrosyl-tRNA(Tyr) deacylase [Muribaculaceae bacterium]|nr:D-tyrosyl-tRNA(Tyr) deacylase [Muribaculaceae bacterium]
MRLFIQRVSEASVRVDGGVAGEIGKGLMVLVGVENGDGEEDADWLASKTVKMRIFPDENDVMNKSLIDVEGEVLAISQFTLTASTAKGNRPSYIRAAKGEEARHLYDYFCDRVKTLIGRNVEKGIFGADMKVSLINDGPVTIIIDSRLRE